MNTIRFFFEARDRHATIRFHKWIDLFVELPLMLGTLITGVWLTFTVAQFTLLHIVKTVCSLIACTLVSFCIMNVLHRSKMLDRGASENYLHNHSKFLMLKLTGFFTFFFIASLALGVILGFMRVYNALFA